mgnify:CR=1 FL=1
MAVLALRDAALVKAQKHEKKALHYKTVAQQLEEINRQIKVLENRAISLDADPNSLPDYELSFLYFNKYLLREGRELWLGKKYGEYLIY